MKAVWGIKEQTDLYKNEDVFDCLIAEFLLSEGRYSPTQMLAFEKYAVSSLEELAKKQEQRLSDYPSLAKLFYEIEMPLATILHDMEKKGILLNTEKLGKLGEEYLEQRISWRKKLLLKLDTKLI